MRLALDGCLPHPCPLTGPPIRGRMREVFTGCRWNLVSSSAFAWQSKAGLECCRFMEMNECRLGRFEGDVASPEARKIS